MTGALPGPGPASAAGVQGGEADMVELAIGLSPEDEYLEPRFRWLYNVLKPYLPLCLVAYTRAGSPLEFGDILSCPSGFTSRQALTEIFGRRATIVALSSVPPLATERWYGYRDDPRITLDARMGGWILSLPWKSAGGFPKLEGIPDGWHLREDARDIEEMDPLEVRYKTELEALVRVDPRSEIVMRAIGVKIASNLGYAVVTPHVYVECVVKDRKAWMRGEDKPYRGTIKEWIARHWFACVHAAATCVDMVSWMAVRSGVAADLVEGAKLAKDLVMAAAWPADEDHASFVRRCRELGDPFYRGTWRTLWGGYDDSIEEFAGNADRLLREWKETRDRLVELGLAYG